MTQQFLQLNRNGRIVETAVSPRLIEILSGKAEVHDTKVQKWKDLLTESGYDWRQLVAEHRHLMRDNPPRQSYDRLKELQWGPAPERVACRHLGECLEKRKGDLCGCKEPQAVHRCAIFGECTQKRSFRKIAACNTCEVYAPPEFRRNLMMHVLPVKGFGGWEANADIIREHRDVFDGTRVIAISTQSQGDKFPLDDPQTVKDRFGPGFDFLEIPNNPTLREVASFVPLMERVKSDDPRDVTFFCHAKGCTHEVSEGTTPHRWRDLMYEVLLHWPTVRDALIHCPIVGALRRFTRMGPRSRWHYSGTFYWFRNRDVFRREWWKIDQRWWGTESWPGVMFAPREAATLLGDDVGSPYDLDVMESLEQELEAWRQSRPQ